MITTTDLLPWCRITYDQLESNPECKVPFRLVKDSDEMGMLMARELVDEIKVSILENKNFRAIIPCGPACWYKAFTDLVNMEKISLKNVIVFHMDECLDWQGKELPRKHPYSFRGFMEKHFYDPVATELAVPGKNRIWLNGNNISDVIAKIGEATIDITYGGWGQDGHIAYNQARRHPFSHISLDDVRNSTVRIQENNFDTIIALAQRTFGSAYQFVPPMSVTLGVKECMSARKVRLFSDTGSWKQTALRVALFGPITPEYPITLCQEHPDALVTATIETATHPISENPDWELIFLTKRMNNKELRYDLQALKFSGIVGTGGIGSGRFFKLNGDNTLGREESRSGHFLDINDYCKQHIILHYISVLLGPSFKVIPIGKIGDDDIGQTLYKEMFDAGLIMDYVEVVPNVPTLFSFCFYYPDGSGGNLTTDNSASSMVDPGFIGKAAKEISDLGSRGIILAVPEVPFDARQELLKKGKSHKMYCTASFTTEEMPTVLKESILENVDLIAINIDEAFALSGIHVDKSDIISIVHATIKKLQAFNRNIMVSITAGEKGSWCWDGYQLSFFPAIKTKVVSTAGAGDAFFSGLICGMVLGLHANDSQQLASLIAGLSVTSPHTIHKGVTRNSINEFMITSGFDFSEKIKKLMI